MEECCFHIHLLMKPIQARYNIQKHPYGSHFHNRRKDFWIIQILHMLKTLHHQPCFISLPSFNIFLQPKHQLVLQSFLTPEILAPSRWLSLTGLNHHPWVLPFKIQALLHLLTTENLMLVMDQIWLVLWRLSCWPSYKMWGLIIKLCWPFINIVFHPAHKFHFFFW